MVVDRTQKPALSVEEQPEQSKAKKRDCKDGSLHSIRRNVVTLLTVLLPQLDMTGISLESDDVDHVLQQVIDVNSLKVAREFDL